MFLSSKKACEPSGHLISCQLVMKKLKMSDCKSPARVNTGVESVEGPHFFFTGQLTLAS